MDGRRLNAEETQLRASRPAREYTLDGIALVFMGAYDGDPSDDGSHAEVEQ